MPTHYLGKSPPAQVLEIPWAAFHPGRDGYFPCVYPVVQGDGVAVLLEHRFELRHPDLGLQGVWQFGFLTNGDVLYCGPNETIPGHPLSAVVEALRRASQESP